MDKHDENPPGAHAPLRIALMTGNFGYIHDGASHTLNHLVDNLLEAGNEVRVYTPLAEACPSRPDVSLFSVPSVSIPKRREYRTLFSTLRNR